MADVLVTGATGMLGSAMVERLLQAGVSVRAAVRPGSDLRHLASLPIEIVCGDLHSDDDACAFVQGCRWVFHIAGYLDMSAPFGGGEDYPRFHHVNVEMTETLLRACLREGVERFVYSSSTSVYSLDAPVPIGEEAPLHPLSNYGRSKLAAEARISAYQEQGLGTTIIRPTAIYGPRDRYVLPTIRKATAFPLLPLIHGGRQRYDLVYVGDVVELMWQSCRSEQARGQVYNSGAGTPQTMQEMLREYGVQTGTPIRICSISPTILRRLRRVMGWYCRRFAPALEALLSDIGLDFLERDVYYDMTRARNDLGYVPQYDIRRGLTAALSAVATSDGAQKPI